MRKFSFEKLLVWDKARNLSKIVYSITRTFPSEEQFGLISQMRRASISISSNIAEGSGRHSYKEKARFTEIAYSSALELMNQTILATDLKLITNENHILIRSLITEITTMLFGLYNSRKSHIS